MIKRILLCLLVFCALSTNAMAAGVPVIVQLGPLGNILNVVNALGGTLLDQIPGTKIYLLSLPNIPTISPLLQSLLGITGLEPDKIIAVPGRGQMGVLTIGGTTAADWYKAQPELLKIRSMAAQSYSRGAGVVIADLNSAVDFAHPALAGHLTGGYDFVGARAGYAGTLNQASSTFLDQASSTFLDQASSTFLDQASSTFLDQAASTFLDQGVAAALDNGNPAYAHGTLCAGVIAAVAPGATIMPLRVFDGSGNSDVFSIAKAIRYAVDNRARVINLSFGMSGTYFSIQNSLAYAASSHVVVVASAGNQNTQTPQFPASVSTVISVAATDINDVKASFSNYGSTVYVTAPGVNIISAYPGGYYGMVSGTSFSAPMVAAEAALILAVKTTDPKSVIGSHTVNINALNPSYVGKLGYGRVDVLSAVQ
jgi:subtilisin family serine protease